MCKCLTQTLSKGSSCISYIRIKFPVKAEVMHIFLQELSLFHPHPRNPWDPTIRQAVCNVKPKPPSSL